MDQQTRIPVNTITEAAPRYGVPQRDAINSVCDGIAQTICSDIADLRLVLDEIENTLLENSARTKQQLEAHVSICTGLKDEVAHLRRVVADLEDRAAEA